MRLENIEQSNLAQALLNTIDKGRPLKTHDVLSVLTQMLTQCVIVHSIDRNGAESTMAGIVHLMDQMLGEADFMTPPPEYVSPSTRH